VPKKKKLVPSEKGDLLANIFNEESSHQKRMTTFSLAGTKETAPEEDIRFDWTVPLNGFNVHSGDECDKAGASSDDDHFLSATVNLQFESSPPSPSPVVEVDIESSDLENFTGKAEKKREASSVLPIAPIRRKKKPKSLPKRPLSAYNLYFQQVRKELSEESESDNSPKIGFHELGKIVGRKWRALAESERKVYQERAEEDSERYRREMAEHKQREVLKKEEESRAKQGKLNLRSQEEIPQMPSSDFSAFHATGASAPPPVSPRQQFLPPGGGYGGMHPHSYQSYAPFPPTMQHSSTSSASWGGTSSPHNHPAYPPPFESRPVLAPPLFAEGDIKNGRPLAPGSEVCLFDDVGRLQRYTVQYTMLTMSRREAQEYMEALKRNPMG
jgi:hypothetical protein